MRRHQRNHASLATRLAAGLASPAGFTLIEIMATALVVILIAAGVAQGLVSGAHLSGYQQHRSQANAIAEQDQERLRGLSAKQLNALSTAQTYTVALNGTTYTVASQATLESTTASVPCSTSGSNAAAYFHTSSTVTWNDLSGGSQSVSDEGIVTPPRSGTLLVSVVDQTGTNPISGATVNISAQNTSESESGTTDASGCIVFLGLAVDTYTVTVSYPGDSTVNDTASVTASGTTRPTNGVEMLASPGAINASLVTNGYTTDANTATVGTITGQKAPEVSWYGAGSTMSMPAPSSTTPGTPTATFSLTNLFPYAFTGPVSYTNNYHVWAGQCQQEQPPSSIDATTVNPGLTTAMNVQEPDLALYTTYGSSTWVMPDHVKITFTSTSGPACTETWDETMRGTPGLLGTMPSNGVLAYPGIPFASNLTSGTTASASGMTGTLSVCADYNSHYTTGGPYFVTLPLSFAAPNQMSLQINSKGNGGGTC